MPAFWAGLILALCTGLTETVCAIRSAGFAGLPTASTVPRGTTIFVYGLQNLSTAALLATYSLQVFISKVQIRYFFSLTR